MRAHNTDSMRTFDMGNSEVAGKIGTDIGDASPSLGEKFSGLEKGKGLNGFSGNIPSVTDGTNTQSSQATQNKGEQRVYKCTEITDPSTGLKVARGYAPSHYTVSGETIWCGQWQSLNYAAQVYLTAMSPDQNTIMGYYSPVGYEQILEYSQNGTDYSWHQDGSFDSTTMMPMLRVYEQRILTVIIWQRPSFRGSSFQIAGQDEISQEEQAILDQKANTNYQGNLPDAFPAEYRNYLQCRWCLLWCSQANL